MHIYKWNWKPPQKRSAHTCSCFSIAVVVVVVVVFVFVLSNIACDTHSDSKNQTATLLQWKAITMCRCADDACVEFNEMKNAVAHARYLLRILESYCNRLFLVVIFVSSSSFSCVNIFICSCNAENVFLVRLFILFIWFLRHECVAV